MARLDEFLARWLLRRLKRDPQGGIDAALQAQLEHQARLLERHRVASKKRALLHQELRKRHLKLKDEFRSMKEEARLNRHEAFRWETDARILRLQVETLEHELKEGLAHPGIHPLLSGEEKKGWRDFVRRHRSVWKHPMRLGVLRQHEPKPLVREHFPRASSSAPDSALPAVTIVTPSFQQAPFLERTILSVLGQDYPRLEYRVCDGGSTDGSIEVIRRQESRLAGWCSEPDSGPAAAINKGFAASTGDIMAWLNSDDLLMPGAVRFVADYLATHPEVDAVYGHRVVIDERDWEVGRWVLPRHDSAMLLWGDYIPQETLFWRRSLWQRTGAALDENYKFAFDWDLLLRFQKAGARIVRLPRFLGCFRAHDAQKSTALMDTAGHEEMKLLRERELGPLFHKDRLGRRVVNFQRKAVWCHRLLRCGIRW